MEAGRPGGGAAHVQMDLRESEESAERWSLREELLKESSAYLKKKR